MALLPGVLHVLGVCAAGRTDEDHEPSIEDYATIEAYYGDTPVYAFGYTYVYGISPDLMPGAELQTGNTNPKTKIPPKKSWELRDNRCGSTPAREPKTMWNDDQPLLPIHLIDGNPETAWSSRGGTASHDRPEWVRIDLPAESSVAGVVLVCSEHGPCSPEYSSFVRRHGGLGLHFPGKALPKKLTVKLSTDARIWHTVYENDAFTGSDSGPTAVEFPAQRAKQVMVVGEVLDPVLNWGPSFSIGQLEVLDEAGDNLALVSQGSGVTVSTTYLGYGMDRFTQDMLWPIQYDLGFKWTRVG